MRARHLVLGQILRRQILQGMLTVEVLPDEPAGGREAMVSIASRIPERRDGLSGEGGAMVRLHAGHAARAVAQPRKLEHLLTCLPVLADDFQEVGATQR